MKWTLDDYLRTTRLQLDEPENDYFTDEELTQYLNMAVSDLTSDLDLTEIVNRDQPTETTSLSFTDLFPNPNGGHQFVKMKRLDVNGKRLEVLPLEESLDTGKGCYITHDRLHFPTPVSGTLRIHYNRHALPLISPDDQTDIDPQFQHLPVLYTIAMAKRKDEEEGIHNNLMEDYYTRKAEMVRILKERMEDAGVSKVVWSYLRREY